MIGRYKTFYNGKTMSPKCDDNKLLKKYEVIFKYISKKMIKDLILNLLMKMIMVYT